MIPRKIVIDSCSTQNLKKKTDLRINRVFFLFNVCQFFFDDSIIFES